jgi:hypothetical protein
MNGTIILKRPTGVEVIDLADFNNIIVTRKKSGKIKLRLISSNAMVKERTIKFMEKEWEDYETFLEGIDYLARGQEGRHLIISPEQLVGGNNEEDAKKVS